MNLEIRPEPDDAERAAIVAALEEEQKEKERPRSAAWRDRDDSDP